MKYKFEELESETFKYLDQKNFNPNVRASVSFKNINSNENTKFINELVVLAFTFNMALENYQTIRRYAHYRTHANGNNKNSDRELSAVQKKYFSAKFLNKLDYYDPENIDNIEAKALSEFALIEPVLFRVLQRFRNFLSHVLHEPGVIKLKDLFDANTNLKDEDFQLFDNWLKNKFELTKNHLTKSLNEAKSNLAEEDPKKITEINNALNYFSLLKYKSQNNNLKNETLLFFACMFLTKKQAKMVLEKWPAFKVIDGYENTIKTFFSYFCLSERFSVNNENINLQRFREIMAQLTAIPIDSNPQMLPIYQKIREMNLPKFEALNNTNDNIKILKLELKNQKQIAREIRLDKNIAKNKKDQLLKQANDKINQLETKIQHQITQTENAIIPMKKKGVVTQIIVQFLIDNKILTNSNNIIWKVAVKKQPADIEGYFEKHADEIDAEKSLVFLKDQMKKAENAAKKETLRSHLKELKRNYKYIDIEQLTDDSQLIVNRKNAMFQLIYGNMKPISITLPPDLLKKWAFISIYDTSENKNNGSTPLNLIENYIKKYLNLTYNKKLDSRGLIGDFSVAYNWISSTTKDKKVMAFPRSLYADAGILDSENRPFNSQILHKIGLKESELKELLAQNEAHPKPFRFNSKQKIDVILDFLHHSLLYSVYSENQAKDPETIIDDIRHAAFSIDDYDIAREYFRFFGRFKNLSIVEGTSAYNYSQVIAFKEKYATYLSSLQEEMEASGSLEELFLKTAQKWLGQLEAYKDDLQKNIHNQLALIKTFKINQAYEKHISGNTPKRGVIKDLCIPDELLQLKEFFSDDWQKLSGENKKMSEFAIMRRALATRNAVQTNADYIFQKIIPKLEIKKNGKLPAIVTQKLLQLKNEELLMLEMAKYYWKKANGVDLNVNTHLGDTQADDYFEFTSYNKIYDSKVKLNIKINLDFKDSTYKIPKYASTHLKNKELEVIKKSLSQLTVLVPARRFDNKFLGSDTRLLGDYILWYEKQNLLKGITKYDYDDLENKILKELGRSMEFIQLVLQAERKIITTDKENFKNELSKKYKGIQLVDFYIDFKNELILEKLKGEISTRIIKKLAGDIKKREPQLKGRDAEVKAQKLLPYLHDYLLLFRNYALHYKLQDASFAQYIRYGLEKFLNEKNTQKPIKK